MLKTLTLIATCLFCLLSAEAQTTRQIDLGAIHKYDTILNRIFFFTDYSKNTSIDELPEKDFSYLTRNKLFDSTKPDAYCFMKVSVYNSGNQDTFWLYLGRAQQFTMYEYDSSKGKLQSLNNQASSFSYAIFNELPYAFFNVPKGESKVFYIRANINFYNWNLLNPIIVNPNELTSFTFEYFLQPNRIYIFVSVLLLGLMLSLFLSFVSYYFLTFDKYYLYYVLALLCYLLYFFLRIFDLFIFSSHYWFFFNARLQLLQIGGSIFILQFVISFLQIHKTLPKRYKYFRNIVLLQFLFLLINVPLTYTTWFNSAGSISFNVLRVFILPYFILLIIAVIRNIKTREAWYISFGSLISIILFLIALYADVISNYQSNYINHHGIALMAFATGILIQMRYFMEAIVFRIRAKSELDIRELERLKFENERTELEKEKAIIFEKEKERNRISQEIHDDIGSGLTSIRLLSEIAKSKSQQGDNKELEKISATSNILIENMNELVWSLNTRNDSLVNLLAFLRHLTVEYFEPLSIQLSITTPDNIPDGIIKGKVRRNILLSVKEALHNIVKHSHATKVQIAFSIDEAFSICISDNGIGFNSTNVQSYKNGLQNIHERLIAIGGTCTISNNGGTSVVFRIPFD